MQPGQYIIIPVADIEEKIKEYEKLNEEYSGDEWFAGSANVLKEILENPTDLYGVVEDACKNGIILNKTTEWIGRNDQYIQQDVADYLNNLEI